MVHQRHFWMTLVRRRRRGLTERLELGVIHALGRAERCDPSGEIKRRNSAQTSASTASFLSEGIHEAGRSVFPSLVGHWLARRTKTDQARRSSRRGTHRQLGLEVGPRIKDADIAEGKVGRPWNRHRPWMLLLLVQVLVGWTNATSRLFSFRSPSCLSWIKLRARPRDGLARAGPPFFFFSGRGVRSSFNLPDWARRGFPATISSYSSSLTPGRSLSG